MLDNSTLIDALHSVTTIPLVPFRGGQIDFHAHIKNIRYLMSHNYLSDGRPRVICVAGTSLIHQIGPDDQNELLKVTSEAMRNEGILISALIPNPLSSVGKLIEVQSQYARPPDAYLIMPVSGIYSSRGLYQNLKTISDRYGSSHQARFLFYHRQQRDRDQIIKLVCDSPFFIGLKVGTIADEVPVLTNGIRDNGIVIWGKGDRSTQAARLGAKGHTSGISVIYAKAGDLINNAQRSGDFEKSWEIEKRITALEELRFANGREHNYSAVLEGMILSKFEDIDGGEGGPLNPRVPEVISNKVREAIKGLEDLH